MRSPSGAARANAAARPAQNSTLPRRWNASGGQGSGLAGSGARPAPQMSQAESRYRQRSAFLGGRMLDFEVVHHLAETQSSARGANADQLFVDVGRDRSEEHTSELQSLRHLVCRLLLEKKKKTQ